MKFLVSKKKTSQKKKVSSGVVVHKKISSKNLVSSKPKTINLSKVKRSTKRFSKQILRDVLLSRLFHTLFKIVVGVVFFLAVSYGLYSYFHTSLNNDVVVSKSEIVDRVAKLTTLPPGTPDAIVRVEDADILKKQNPFYENVKSGDYILMYPKLAVIYDLRNNSIIAVKKSE